MKTGSGTYPVNCNRVPCS